MLEARRSTMNNATLYKKFKHLFSTLPNFREDILTRCHKELVLKSIKARVGTVFKLFHDHFIGHYSKRLNVEFRKILQITAKNSKQKEKIKLENVGED